MINSKNNLISKPGEYRQSVLDALLNRNVSENYSSDRSSGPPDPCSDSEKLSYRNSQALSPNSTDYDVVDSGSWSPLPLGTRTPTNIAEQLPILLARKYYSAPACLLRFVNLTSSIRSSSPQRRDSDVSVIDNEMDFTDDFNLDPNDDIGNFKSDEEVPEILSVGALSNGSPLVNNPLHCSDDSGYVDVDPVDINVVLQSVNSKYGSHFDKGCSPFFDMKETNGAEASKVRVDVGTSPLVLDKSHGTDDFPFNGSLDSDSHMVPEDTKLDYYVDGAKTLNTTDPETEFFSPGFGSEKEHAPSPGFSTLKSGDFSVKKSEFSADKQIPVYCRSLLYRIRVPLSKRLKNVDEDVLVRSMASPLLSESRANLSCDRLYSSRPRLSNSADSSRSFLRLSDLDSHSVESRAYLKTAKPPSGSNDPDKRCKRGYSGSRHFEGPSKHSKRYKRVR
ncbi:conserved hypothetical protein [Theileria orientalis strain Shintoku]|uniref:Uncharacterized protein n=1 Tax=Theileria orientalis strain Shintoku TaxID=869250 RepID=J7M823_THEOR|nr:conserved hypothetical protein [Theileria orientalis strain Shintoku]PVC54718.1 hypothetical protein MACL_00000700 [Theileria orientalis]BAM38563.1 conserved hypothetical protein [Theileria orientalis strain Shintoku]|eukprot:XP_009688864.1 conserved hypothetical protein [Theileria orientalis strain Shintoku]